MNIAMILQMAADTMPERIAVVCGDQRVSYADLAKTAIGAASVQNPDEKLGFLGESSPAAPAALFAAAIAGVPFVPINYRLTDDQISALLKRISPARVITERALDANGVRAITGDEFLSLAGEDQEVLVPDDAEIAIELFTSGTTGEPKSAILRHANLMAYILNTVEFMIADEGEAALISVPPYHIAGISAVLSSTYAGRRMVQLPNFTAEAWLDLACEENVTNAFLVPTMLQRIVEFATENKERAQLPALRSVAYGGGKMPLPVIEAAMDLFPDVSFTNAYGLTETSSTICLLDPDVHRVARASDDPKLRRRLSSVGRPLPTIELEVRREDGSSCEPEETGLVYVRGDQVSGDYKGLGSQLDDTGWFPTKDRGFLDDEGFLFLDGRDDDVIVRGGENISPGEIEDVLLSHPTVKDVAVVAAPDAEWGEAVVAAIVVKDTQPAEDTLREFVCEQLRSSKVPSQIRFVQELPYNETGKLLRRVIRDSFTD